MPCSRRASLSLGRLARRCGHPIRRVAASCREGLTPYGQSRSGQERSGTERRSSARTPVLAPGPALGSHLCVALSSAQVRSVVISRKVSSNAPWIFWTIVRQRRHTAWECTARRGRVCINGQTRILKRGGLTRSEQRITSIAQKSWPPNLRTFGGGPVLAANDDLVAHGQPTVV